MSPLIRILTASLILAAACKAEEAKQSTVSVPVQYLEVTDAYQQLRASFPDIGKIVKDIQIAQNALTLNSGHAKYAEVRKKLTEMDVRPRQVLLSAIVSEMQPDGTETVVSRRSFTTLEGRAWNIYESDGNRKFKLSMTVTVPKDAPTLRK